MGVGRKEGRKEGGVFSLCFVCLFYGSVREWMKWKRMRIKMLRK